MSDMFMAGILKSLIGGGGMPTKDQPWNPAAGLYNGGMGEQYAPKSLLGQKPTPETSPDKNKDQSLLGQIGNALIPQTMSSMGKGGGV